MIWQKCPVEKLPTTNILYGCMIWHISLSYLIYSLRNLYYSAGEKNGIRSLKKLNQLAFPILDFGEHPCTFPAHTPWKRIKINGFWPYHILPNAFPKRHTEDKPWHLRRRSLLSDLTWYDSIEMWAYNFLRTKYFHEVSPASLHAYSLKSRYGKVSGSNTWVRIVDPFL